MKVVSVRTGLSPHVIRIWEKRYEAVKPGRTGTNRRLYSEEDIARLGMLSDLTQHGHSIGRIAQLGTEELRKMLAAARAAETSRSDLESPAVSEVEGFLLRGMQAVHDQDAERIERNLDDAVLLLGHAGMLRRVVVPLVHRIGEAWHAGDISAAQEHVATIVIRRFLLDNAHGFSVPESAPTLVVGTPAGQIHEIGAAIVAAAARLHGWRIVYLGPSLPAHEIAATAHRRKARAVALSIVYPPDDPDVGHELRTLREKLPTRAALFIGGRAAHAYRDVIEEIGARLLETLDDLFTELDALRATPVEE